MKLFKDTIAFLTSGEFFTGVIERLFALTVSIVVFAAVILCYIYKPNILLYFLILGMLVMGWFMLYFIFPEIHEWINGIKRLMGKLLAKYRLK